MTPDAVTVVSGLPRSGTSLMMKVLKAGGMPVLTDAARAADDDNPRGYFEFEPVKLTKQDPSWLAAAGGKVVKMVHLLLPDLPPAYAYRVVLMRRDLAEVLASQRKMLDRHGRRGAALPDDQLSRLYTGQLTRVKGWLASQPNFAVLEVSYNDLVSDPAGQAGAVNAFLGGTLNEAAMAAAVDPSLYRNRVTGGGGGGSAAT